MCCAVCAAPSVQWGVMASITGFEHSKRQPHCEACDPLPAVCALTHSQVRQQPSLCAKGCGCGLRKLPPLTHPALWCIITHKVKLMKGSEQKPLTKHSSSAHSGYQLPATSYQLAAA